MKLGRITKNELAPKLKRQIDESTHFMSNPYIHTHATLEDIPRTFNDVFNYDETNQRTLLVPETIGTKLDYASSKYGTFPSEKINGLCIVDAYTKQIASYCEDGWYANGILLLLISEFTTNMEDNECEINTTVTLSCKGQGSGVLTYKFTINDLDTQDSHTIRDYGTDTDINWKAMVAGNKLLTVYCKSSDPFYGDLEVSKQIRFTVLPRS